MSAKMPNLAAARSSDRIPAVSRPMGRAKKPRTPQDKTTDRPRLQVPPALLTDKGAAFDGVSVVLMFGVFLVLFFVAGEWRAAVVLVVVLVVVFAPGALWRDTAMRGYGGTGFVNNALYMGCLVWSRLRCGKDPI
jgi:hypothetical protein